MYESFYHLKEKPFSLLPDPGFLYLSQKHRMALVLLEYGLSNQAGFSVVTGDIGTGKTTLIRHLLNQMGRDVTVGLITNTHRSFGVLLQWVLMSLNLDHHGKDKVAMYETLVDFLIKEFSRRRRTMLIVDEAQNMSPEALEELRMLSNINADKNQVLQVILVGQPGLRETLRRPDLEQFAQRIAVDYDLKPLNASETREYLRHRVAVAGGSPDLFTDGACEVIYRHSGGTPRLINLLADTALVYGYAEQTEQISRELAEEVAQDKVKGGIFPSRHTVTEPIAEPELAAPSAVTAPLPDGIRRKLRLAVASNSEQNRLRLQETLELHNMQVVLAISLSENSLRAIPRDTVDVLLVDVDDEMGDDLYHINDVLEQLDIPLVYHDGSNTLANGELDDNISRQIMSLMPAANTAY
ncbi:MAG: ExeA family protein [Gammaproteobacteria bacterium]